MKVFLLGLGMLVLPEVLLTSSVLAAESSGPREVTAAVVASFPPFYQLNEIGHPTGFAIESMDEVAKLSGVRINYLVFDTWAEVLDAVRVGKAQLVPNLGITEDRKQDFFFTSSVITFPISIITRSDTTDVNGLSGLVGRRVGMVEKNAAIELLKEREDITQTVYESFPGALFELLAGKLDAIVYPELVAWKFATDAGLEAKIKVVGVPLKEVKRAIAIGKNEKNLIAILEPAAEELIKSPRYREIYLSWFGEPKPSWTKQHTARTAGGLFVVFVLSMFGWRYLSIVRLNKTIQQSQQKFEDISMNVPGVVYQFMIDKKGQASFPYVSPTVETVLGLKAANVVSNANELFNAVHPDDSPGLFESMAESRRTLAAWQWEGRIIGTSKEVRWFRVDSVPRKTGDGSVLWNGVIFDISDLRDAQESLRVSQDHLEDKIKSRTAELKLSEEKFRGIFDHSSIAVATSNEEGKLIVWNDAFRKMFGYEDEELVRSSCIDLSHADDVELCRDYLGRIFRGEVDSFRIEQRWIRKDKSIWWGEISVVPLRDSSGNITSSIANILDITEGKMAERGIQEREDQLREFGASASDWYWEMDENLSFSYFSENFTNVTGVAAEYLIGKTRQESGNPGIEQEQWEQHLDDLANHRPFRNFVHPRTKSDSTIAWLSINGKPMIDADGRFHGYRGIGLDITETKISQRQLLDLSSAIDQMSEPVVVFDNQDRFIFTNQAYRELNSEVIETIQYGMKFEDHIRAIADKGLAPDSEGRKQDWIDESMASHRNPSDYFELKRQDGTWFLGIEKKLPSGGQVLLLTDISQIKKNQEELVKAKEDAESANQAKTEFLSSMSHELRTPMHAILGFAQMLELNPEEPLSENQENFVKHILKGGGHLLELIDQVLELNEIEANRLSLNVTYVSLRDIIDESLGLISTRAQVEGIEIVDQTSTDGLPWLWTDGTRLTQVLLNLLSNAVKYNCEKGSVTLTCEERPDHMFRISVTDTGTGIPVREQTNLFKPFERLGRESGEIEGTGIGLTITRQIIELLGGQVNYKSGKMGSTFWVDVPTVNKIDGLKVPVASIVKPFPVNRPKKDEDGFVHTILYVEDNPDNMRLMETIIGQLTNTKMLTAYNAELGIDLARRNHPDLILMDLNLPGINGIEALKQLQEITQTKDIPVIAITAAALPKDVEKGMEAGFREYITKPINVSNILRVIEETIDSA